MVNSQDADTGSVVEDHDQNSLSLGAEKIGTKRPTEEQAAAERADQLAVLQKTATNGWSGKKLALHTIAFKKLTDKVHTITQKQ